MTLQKPNTEQAIEGSLAGVQRETLTKWLRDEVDDMLPARVVSYNDATNRAVIQPLVMIGTTGGGKVSRAQVASVPVYRFGGGGFFMRFPIKPGDLGWLKANDRDTSLIFQAGGGEDWPNTKRLHSFSDAMFFPDTFKSWVIDGAHTDGAVWQSLDGTVVVALDAGKITLKAGASTITMTPSGVAIVSPSLTHNGINVGATHTHSGVTVGAANTGAPNP